MCWHEERFYTAGPVSRNGASDLANAKPWVSMLLSWNEFTIPTHVTFLAFGLSTNVKFDTTNQLATQSHYTHETRCESWLIARVWL